MACSYTYNSETKIICEELSDPTMKHYSIANLLERKRLNEALIADQQDQISKINALLNVARDHGYSDGDDVGSYDETAKMIRL